MKSSPILPALRRAPGPEPVSAPTADPIAELAAAEALAPVAPSQSLRVRLISLVALALLPGAALSIFQGFARYERDYAVARERLVNRAIATASADQNLFSNAETILTVLSSQISVENTGNCEPLLKGVLISLPEFLNIAFFDNDGRLVCSAVTPPSGYDARAAEWWKAAQTDNEFAVTGPEFGRLVQRDIYTATLPVIDSSGELAGMFSMPISADWLQSRITVRELADDELYAIIDSRTGEVMAADKPEKADELFSRPILVGEMLQTAEDAHGVQWSFAAAPLLADKVAIVFAKEERSLFASTYWNVGADFLFPLVMMLFASIAIWLGTEHLISRWVDYLRRISGAYARGRYSVGPSMAKAPAELRILGADLATMSQTIGARDAALQAALAQKTNLIREVHHRVKNNLQMVMSILSIQASGLKDPAARAALEQSRLRVNALALVHRLLYEIEELTAVDMQLLMTELCGYLRSAYVSEAARVRLDLRVDKFSLPTDIATPLVLLAVEAITNCFRHGFPEGASGVITLDLSRANGVARLTIDDSGVGMAPANIEASRVSIGSRLMKAFAQQMGGTLTTSAHEGGGYKVCVEFPVDNTPASAVAA
ncbi:MAG: sensor histidine kinase [Parvularculaceae bacterium]